MGVAIAVAAGFAASPAQAQFSSADLSITKTDGVPTATPGGSTTYTITASNAGPDAVTGATVADTFPASLTATWRCDPAGGGTCGVESGVGNINQSVNLPAGGSVTYTASATISGSASGSLENTATVDTPGGVTDPNGGNDSATDVDALTPRANLAITKTDGVTTATPGDSVTYTITASNSGPSNVIGATVADTFPASLSDKTWTCLGAGGGTCTAGPVNGDINDTVNLPAGGSVTYMASASINPNATGSLANTATVMKPGVTDPDGGNNSATDNDALAPRADLSITKTDGVTTATPGDSVTYEITAANAGPSDVTGATVADTFPASLSSISWSCVGAGGGTCTAGPVNGNINDTVNLPAGGSVTYTASATISGSASGSLANTATVDTPGGVTDPNGGNDSDTDVDTLIPQRTLTVTTSGSGSGFVSGSGIDCGGAGHGDCSQTVSDGQTIELTANPASDSDFSGFTGSGGCGVSSPCTVTMNADKSVDAGFTQTPSVQVTPALDVTGVELDREKGTATLTVEANVPGSLRIDKTNKVKGFGPVDLPEAGSADLEVVPRNKAAKELRRSGRVTVNPRAILTGPEGEIAVRHEFDLRQD